MFDEFGREPPKPIQELNIVPIMDVFTTVIFFLLLTTTFIALTKLTVPPSRVKTVTEPQAPPPVGAKLIVLNLEGQGMRLALSWAGPKPGQRTKALTHEELTGGDRKLTEASQELITKFSEAYPNEKTIQLGLGRDVSYERMIAVMDGVRHKLQDVVLISYREAEVRGADGGDTE